MFLQFLLLPTNLCVIVTLPFCQIKFLYFISDKTFCFSWELLKLGIQDSYYCILQLSVWVLI